MYEFVGDNHLEAIEGCWTGGKQIETQIQEVIADFGKNLTSSNMRALITLKNIVSEIPTEIATCKDISSDIASIEEWANIFTDKTKLIARVTRNLAMHHKAISSDIQSLKSDFNNE